MTPAATFDGDVLFTSNRTYPPGCYKGVVVEVTNIDNVIVQGGATGAPPGPPPGGLGAGADAAFERARIAWADAPLLTQAECEASWVASYVFQQGINPWFVTDFLSARGLWTGAQCIEPSLDIRWLVPGENYRFAATARVDKTSTAATRKVSID